MTDPITIPDVLACIYLAQAAVGLRPRPGGPESVPTAWGDETLEPLVKSSRPVAGLGDFTEYASDRPLTGVRLAAAVVLSTRVLCDRQGRPKPGPVHFTLARNAPAREAFEFVARSEFGAPSSRSGGDAGELELSYGGPGEAACHVYVAGPQSLSDPARAIGSGLDLHFHTGSGAVAQLREGDPAEREVPDPLARQRSVPLILDLVLGRRRVAPAITRVVCGLEATDLATDERLAHVMNLLIRK
jgi:hypothetical protein